MVSKATARKEKEKKKKKKKKKGYKLMLLLFEELDKHSTDLIGGLLFSFHR
jgi:hypothetical protein